MKVFVWLCLVFLARPAWGQWQTGTWIRFDPTQIYMKYREPGAMHEHGALPGVQVELGTSIWSNAAISVTGKYNRGYLRYDGSTFGGGDVSTVTDDYIRTTESKLYFYGESFLLFAGYGERFWSNDLTISYLRETTYKYAPVGITFRGQGLYLTLAYNSFLEGVNKSYMSKVDPNRSNVTVKQKDGSGQTVELGLLWGQGGVATKLSVFYERWDIGASEVGNDGVQNLIEPENTTDTYGLSLGLIF